MLRVLVEMLRDEDVQQVLDRMIVKRIAEPQWGPPIGRVLATLLAEGRQEALLQLLADRAFQWSLNAGEIIERVVERDSPTWSPRWVDHLVGDRIHRELMDFTDKVRRNPDHELRRSATRFLFEFADDLQHDDGDDRARPRTSRNRSWPATRSPGPPRRRGARPSGSFWSRSTTRRRRCAPASPTPWCTSANRCATTPTCATRSTTGSSGRLSTWSPQYGAEITAIITETIERWDADEASRRIELHVGRDLQFIRINGTVVGALAGLIIYSIAQLLF